MAHRCLARSAGTAACRLNDADNDEDELGSEAMLEVSTLGLPARAAAGGA